MDWEHQVSTGAKDRIAGHIFVSFPYSEHKSAERVVAQLERHELRCWIAPRDVLPGTDYQESIDNAVKTSRLFLLLLSTETNRSPGVQHELALASRQLHKPVVVARLQNVEPENAIAYLVNTAQWTDLFPRFNRSVKVLATRLIKILSTEHGASAIDPDGSDDDKLLKPPPQLPKQSSGPHVEIDLDGAISFPAAEALDSYGNYLPRLKSLHPDLRDVAIELSQGLARGNVPHAVVRDRATAYAVLIDQDLQAIDFRRLYAAGLRLANAVHATKQAIAAGDLPPFGLREQEQLESLAALHGAFILSTAAGVEAIVDEERYARNPTEEKQYRADALVVARCLQNRPDLIRPDVADHVLAAATEMEEGANPERSTVAGRAMVRNVLIGIASGALGCVALYYVDPLLSEASAAVTFVGTMALSDSVKKTKWFKLFTATMAEELDSIVDKQSQAAAELFRSRLRQHSRFVEANEDLLRRLAGERNELTFLHRSLDWLDAQAAKSKNSEIRKMR